MAIVLGILKFICAFVGVFCLLLFILSIISYAVRGGLTEENEDNLRLTLALIISICAAVLMII
jgi:hypothetical protein